MQVRELGNRVFQIYTSTILVGTSIASIIMTMIIADIYILLIAFGIGLFITGLLSLLNIFILNLGLKYIYKNAKNEGEKRHYFIYLWLLLSATPLLIYTVLFMDGSLFSSPQELLLPLPYILASLYYIFKINNKFDKIYPPDFSENREVSTDILDDGF